MLRHNGGEMVGKGTYWNLSNGERVDIEEKGTLPGGRDKAFYRMPAAAVLAIAPILGLMYAAFLPFIGIAMLAKLVAEKAAEGVREMVPVSATFAWRPGESYLAGRRTRERRLKSQRRRRKIKKAEYTNL